MAAVVSEAAEATAKEKAEAAGEKGGGGGGGGDDSEDDEDDVFEVEKILDVKTEGVRLEGGGPCGKRADRAGSLLSEGGE